VSGTTPTRDPIRSTTWFTGSDGIFRPGLGDQTLRTLAKLWRVLPRMLA